MSPDSNGVNARCQRDADIAARFARAMTSGDDDVLAALLAPDAVVWHNHDERSQTVAENVRSARWLRARLNDMQIDDLRQELTENGFVQRHVITGTAPGGPVRLCCALIAQIDTQGAISRIDEYLDSAGLRPLFSESGE